jgi:hypothetical protein
MNSLKARSEADKKAQKDAMMQEIKRQCSKYYRGFERELMAQFLWYLHEKKGYEYDELKDFYFDYTPIFQEMLDRYEMSDNDAIWLCTYKLKNELGIDLAEWEKESN